METLLKPIEARSLETSVKGGPWLLTGPSGAGKDYVIDKFAKNLKFQALDEIASEKDGKWLVDVSLIDDSSDDVRVYGTADNLVEVAKTLLSLYEPGAKLKVCVVMPDPELYRQAISAKLKNKAGSVHSSFAEKWRTRQTWSDSKIRKYLENWVDVFAKKLPSDVVWYGLTNSLDRGERVIKGWHGESFEKAHSSGRTK